MKEKRILITGGTGLVGSTLIPMIQEKGFEPVLLSRTAGNKKGIKTYAWDPMHGHMDPAALDGVTAIIHLAGATVAKRWTPRYKQEIMDSRVLSTRLLLNTLAANPHQVKTFVSASAIGIYPDHPDQLFAESAPPANDFLGQVVQHWEREVSLIGALGLRTAMLRTGLVLSNSGGALAPIRTTVKWGLGSSLGSGRQWVSWIHVQDLCNMFLYAIKYPLEGPVNAVAPHPVPYRELVREVGRVLNRPILFPPVPAFLLKALLGEMATVVLRSNKVASEKIQEAGFQFDFDNLRAALEDVC
jgi:uncharacterized protein (TIGR01777 family)